MMRYMSYLCPYANYADTQEAQRHGGAPLPCPALRLVAWQLLLALAHCHEHKVGGRGPHNGWHAGDKDAWSCANPPDPLYMSHARLPCG